VDVSTNVRPSGAAALTREVVPYQRRSPRAIHAQLVKMIERNVQTHSDGQREHPRPANAHQKKGEKRARTMEASRRGVSRGLGFVEQPHSRARIQATLTQAEPQVMVRVDEDATRPDAEDVTAEPRA